jgi:cell division transport system permease protein
MLFIFAVFLLVNKVVDSYKYSIMSDYSIIVISNTPFSSIDTIADMRIKEIEPINRRNIIESVKDNLSSSSVELLDKKLPYFYKIYLESFPTTSKLKQIRQELQKIQNVKKVETFSNDHSQIYSILILLQDIVFLLFVIVLVLSFLLLSKQIKIWFYEHNERITITQLHGGSLFYSSKPIIKTIFFSALFSSTMVIFALFMISNNLAVVVQPEIISILPKVIHLEYEVIQIIVLSFVIPFLTFFGLLIQYKMK